jgi:hypothetical protein
VGLNDAQLSGWPLDANLADLLGYDVAHEDWPEWIDRLAKELAG